MVNVECWMLKMLLLLLLLFLCGCRGCGEWPVEVTARWMEMRRVWDVCQSRLCWWCSRRLYYSLSFRVTLWVYLSLFLSYFSLSPILVASLFYFIHSLLQFKSGLPFVSVTRWWITSRPASGVQVEMLRWLMLDAWWCTVIFTLFPFTSETIVMRERVNSIQLLFLPLLLGRERMKKMM